MLLFNGTGSTGTQTLPRSSAIAILDGEWPSAESFGLRFEGHGTVSLWLEGSGEVSPYVTVGPRFPLSQKEGTINIPGCAPELIAVGATLNRTEWTDIAGVALSRPTNGAMSNSLPDTIAYFSSAGPNALGGMKPDIVAPGANVIGAMSTFADPRRYPSSMFANPDFCGSVSQCLLVDDRHAIATGTSMASPLVAGVVALLLQQEPNLTQPQIRALLQAGARRLTGAESFEPQVGPGALDARGALEALRAPESAVRLPSAGSWISLPSSYAHPDPNWPLLGYAELRDESGKLADGFAPSRLGLQLVRAELSQPLKREAAGLYSFAVTAPAGSGGAKLEMRLTFDGAVIAERTLPIAVDRGALLGLAMPRGGCSFGGAPARSVSAFAVLALALGIVRRRRSFTRAS
ncbi:MAG: S8 family serine peptidase [Polyangiaceae bacterium]